MECEESWEIGDGRLRVLREGRARRFVPAVDQVSFSASEARRRDQSVLYVTERAVFALGTHGLTLVVMLTLPWPK